MDAARQAPAQCRIAIIIDDWGYSTRNCSYLKEINFPLAVAVLPSLLHTQDVIECAHANGKEIMLHLPLEPHYNTDSYPSDYIIITSMSDAKVDRIMENILMRMPHIAGVNNHMGSKATEDRRMMTILLKKLKDRGLFFVDSRVTPNSVAAKIAREQQVPFTVRDIFLDNQNDRPSIDRQMALLAKVAKQHGHAVAIGHDRELTMQVLKDQLPHLQSQGFKIVTVQELVR